jgi:hypothetical protein
MQNVLRRTNNVAYNPKSTIGRARSQSYFECYVLSAHPEDPYAKFLQKVSKLDPGDKQKIVIQSPSNQLLRSWMFHLHDDEDLNALADSNNEPENPTNEPIRGRMNKKSTIDCHLKNLSGVLLEFGGAALKRSPEIKKILKDWESEDDVNRAEAFLLEELLPKLFDALFNKLTKLSFERKVHLWARLLGQIATISRSSDVTGKYCPIIQDCKFPSTSTGYLPDGNPAWIQVVWKDWKSRPLRYKKAPHKIKIHANPLDLRFCPLHWLQLSWSFRKDLDEENAPVYFPLTSGQYQRQLINLFNHTGANIVPSSHSLRRSAAQWAARCGADINIIRNVGRWETLQHLIGYIAEGHELSTLKVIENNGTDPIFNFWCFHFGSQVTSMNTTLQQAMAMEQRTL